MCQPFCAGLLLHFLQVKISHLHLQLPGQQTQQVSQVLQQMHRGARKQPTRKTHKLVNAGLTLFSGRLWVFYIMYLSVLLWLKQEAAYWWRWEDRIYRRGRVARWGERVPSCWLQLWRIFREWPWNFCLSETMATRICSCKIISCLTVSDYMPPPNSEVESLHKEEKKYQRESLTWLFWIPTS